MRRILWMAAVGLLVLAVAAPAMAFDFKFGGLARTRFYDIPAIGFDSSQTTNAGNNIRGADLLFRLRFDASDDNGNVLSVVRLRIGKIVFGSGGGTENPVQFAAPAPQSTFGNDNPAGNGAILGGKTGYSTGGGLGTRGTNIETEWAYLDFALPFNIPLRIRAGLQPFYTPKGIIIDDNAAGVRLYGSVAPITYEASWWRFDSGQNPGVGTYSAGPIGVAGRYNSETTDNNYDVFGAAVNWAIMPAWTTGIYGYYGIVNTNCAGNYNNVNEGIPALNIVPNPTNPCPNQNRTRNNYYLGWTNTGKIGIVNWDFDLVYGNARGGSTGNFVAGSTTPGTTGVINASTDRNNNLTPILVQGWAVDGSIHFPIGPVKIDVGGSWASGDDRSGSSPAFPGGYSPSWKGPGGFTQFIGDAGAYGWDVVTSTQSSMTNLWTVGLAASYNPVKALTLKVVWGYAGFTNKNGNCALAVSPGGIGTSCYGAVYFGSGFQPQLNAAGLPNSVAAQTNGPNDPRQNNSGSVPVAQGKGGLAGKAGLGNEIDLMAFWNVWTNFNINAMAGWMIPTAGDTAGLYILNFVYSF